MKREENIIQYSPARSGSTLITQILNELFTNVTKYHHFEETKLKIVIAFRHPCANFASLCRIRAKTDSYQNDVFSIKSISDFKRIRKSIRSTKKAQRCLAQYYKTYNNAPLYLQYETFTKSYPYIFGAIEQHFGITIDKDKRAEIEQKTSRDTNANISKNFEQFKEHDKLTGIHGHHVSTKELRWEEQIPPMLRGLLCHVFLRKEIQLYKKLSCMTPDVTLCER